MTSAASDSQNGYVCSKGCEAREALFGCMQCRACSVARRALRPQPHPKTLTGGARDCGAPTTMRKATNAAHHELPPVLLPCATGIMVRTHAPMGARACALLVGFMLCRPARTIHGPTDVQCYHRFSSKLVRMCTCPRFACAHALRVRAPCAGGRKGGSRRIP